MWQSQSMYGAQPKVLLTKHDKYYPMQILPKKRNSKKSKTISSLRIRTLVLRFRHWSANHYTKRWCQNTHKDAYVLPRGTPCISTIKAWRGRLARYSSFDTNLDLSSMPNMFSSRNAHFEPICRKLFFDQKIFLSSKNSTRDLPHHTENAR